MSQLQPGFVQGLGDFLDILVVHEQGAGLPGVPMTFRVVGLMAKHWGEALKPGHWVTLSGSICVDGSPQDETLYTYYLVQAVTPIQVS